MSEVKLIVEGIEEAHLSHREQSGGSTQGQSAHGMGPSR